MRVLADLRVDPGEGVAAASVAAIDPRVRLVIAVSLDASVSADATLQLLDEIADAYGAGWHASAPAVEPTYTGEYALVLLSVWRTGTVERRSP